MKKKKLFTMLCLITWQINIYAQNIVNAPTLIGATGGSGNSGTIHTDWAVGEAVIQTGTGTNLIVTQGFEQPQQNFVGIQEENSISGDELSVFPNPVTDEVTLLINMGSEGNLIYNLFDIKGAFIEKMIIPCNGNKQEQKISFYALSSGHYFMDVLFKDKNNKTRTTNFKIQKIN